MEQSGKINAWNGLEISFDTRFPSLGELMKFLLKHRQPFHTPDFSQDRHKCSLSSNSETTSLHLT